MANYPMFISYYTKSHKELADRLITSLDKFELPHDIIEVPDLQNDDEKKLWAQTCQQRCTFIREMLNKYHKVVWMDSDTIVVQEPKLFAELRDPYMIGISMRPCGVLGGVIWANESSKWFWDLVSSIESPDEDARTSTAVWQCRKNETPLHIYPLPIAYQYVPWLMHLESAIPDREVFILHLMAHSKAEHDEAWVRWHRGLL